mgnify:CR=1 FL=1
MFVEGHVQPQYTMPYTPLAKSVLDQSCTKRQLALAKLEIARVKKQLQRAYQDIDELSAELVQARMLLDSLHLLGSAL